MGKKKRDTRKKCVDCIHYFACDAWTMGALVNTEAVNCINYETVKECTAYFIGYRDGRKESEEENT